MEKFPNLLNILLFKTQTLTCLNPLLVELLAEIPTGHDSLYVVHVCVDLIFSRINLFCVSLHS